MDQLSVEAKIQIESKIQDIVADLLVRRSCFLCIYSWLTLTLLGTGKMRLVRPPACGTSMPANVSEPNP